MVPVKIDCACGWHFAFDAEPVNERMAAPVLCPGCGADVTMAANAGIARYLAANRNPDEMVIIHPAKRELHLETPVNAPAAGISTVLGESPQAVNTERGLGYSARELGLVSKEQALVDARAKVSWGDEEVEVVKYLMMQGYSAGEAQELVAQMFKERRAATRVNGIRKLVIGICLLAVAAVMWWGFMHMGMMYARVTARGMGAAVLIGCVGIWYFANGVVLLLAPKMDHQDLAEQ